MAPRAMPTYKLPLEQVPEQSYSLSPGGGSHSSLASSLAASARFELTATLSGNHFRVSPPVATASGAQSPQSPQTPQTHRVEQILTAHRMPPSQAAPLTYRQWVSYDTTPRSPVASPAPLRCRSPCQSPGRVIQNMEPQLAKRRAASTPARIVQVSEWSFLVPRGSVGPKRAEFDGGEMFRALDRERTGSIGPEEVAEYIATPRRSSLQDVQHPIHSPRQAASPRLSPCVVALPVLGQSTSVSNVVGASPVYNVRRSQLNSPAVSEASSRTTLGRGRERFRWPEIRDVSRDSY